MFKHFSLKEIVTQLIWWQPKQKMNQYTSAHCLHQIKNLQSDIHKKRPQYFLKLTIVEQVIA